MQYLSVGIIGPYFALYLLQRNFTGLQIGLLLGSMPIATIIFQPLWSFVSDLLNIKKLVLVVSCFGLGFSIISLGFTKSFLGAFVLGITFAGIRGPIQPISTALALEYLEEREALNQFGLLRLWGSMAFAISSLILGGLFLDQILIYFSWILGGLYFLLAGISIFLPNSGMQYSSSAREGLLLVSRNPRFALFLVGSTFIGASLGISMSYLTIFMQTLNSTPLLIGVTVSLQAVFEVPLMILVPTLSKRFSREKMILFGAGILPIRWLVYVFVQDPMWIVPTQILHSIAIVSFMVVGVSFVDEQISKEWRATGQGVYTTMMSGFGAGVGIYLAGMIFERFGIRAIWGLNISLGVIGIILIIFALRKIYVAQHPTKGIQSCRTI